MSSDLEIIHLIPHDGVGGVESAARTLLSGSAPGITFKVRYIFRNPDEVTVGKTGTLKSMIRTVRDLMHRSPDVLIVSLWRACIVGVLVKLLRPRTRLVLMLHSTHDAHLVDKLATRMAALLSFEIWGDSAQTLLQRCPGSRAKPRRVISFVAFCLEPLASAPVQPVFIFWGRLHPGKGLDRALKIFAAVHRMHASSRFVVIGPDGGALADLKAETARLGLISEVSFLGAMSMPEIVREARTMSFYLQASSREGMGMSVVEAMQLGLVPVVTPVGEIGTYCSNGKNALFIDDSGDIVHSICHLIENPDKYAALRAAAIATWRGMPVYSESVLQACQDLHIRTAKRS